MPVYVAARDLAGAAFVGTHQYLIVVPNKAEDYAVLQGIAPKDLGDGTMGFVIGAQNRGHLACEFFEKSDYQATKEHYNPSKYVSWYAADFDTEVHKVNPNGKTDSALVQKILWLAHNYRLNETHLRHTYPTAGFGVNSNSWAQTIVQLAGGTVTEDFKGADIGHEKRLSPLYFYPQGRA